MKAKLAGLSPDQLAKHVAPMHTPEATKKRYVMRLGPNHPGWRGSNAGYGALHDRLKKARGRANRCEECGTTEKRRYDWANLTGKYDDLNDYKQMCIPCHRRFDRDRKRVSGDQDPNKTSSTGSVGSGNGQSEDDETTN